MFDKEKLLKELIELKTYDEKEYLSKPDSMVTEFHRGCFITLKTLIDVIQDGRYDID